MQWMYCSFHVDINVLKREIKEIVKDFHGFNVVYDNELIKYLGMEIIRNKKDDVIITMKEYTRKLLKDNNISNIKSTPGLRDDFKFDDSSNKVNDKLRIKNYHT
jgi:hypothetical protein